MLRRYKFPGPGFKGRGFTLIESLAAAALMAVGITASMSALGAVAKEEARAREVDFVQRLARAKYDELVSTNQQTIASQSGDFSDRNIQGYTWNLDVESSTVNNLDTVTVTVQKQNGGSGDPEGIVEKLIYISPSTTSTTTTGTGIGTGTGTGTATGRGG
jgi:prepilin-type N-terminal cleavage/methylation domain-containing protein